MSSPAASRRSTAPSRSGTSAATWAITAFGAQILELPPEGRALEHDHTEDGQEELYLGLEGSGCLEVDGTPVPFGPRTAIFVKPTAMRQMVAGEQGLVWLCVGAEPGAYDPPAFFK
jgi:hypothetical protein